MSEEKNENLESTGIEEAAAEVVKPEGGRVEVSADLLNEAVSQLRKLTEIRQREAERQERAIAQMHKAIKRQGILSRYVILTCTLAVLVAVGVAYLIAEQGKKVDTAASSLSAVETSMKDSAAALSEAADQQAAGLDNVRGEVAATREETARLTQSISQELQANRSAQETVARTFEEQLTAVRGERDQIREEVRNVLDEKTAEIASREMALVEEREAIAEATERSKEEQKVLIQQTIERLAAMAATLDGDTEAAPPTDAEIDEMISDADQVEAELVAEEQVAGEVQAGEEAISEPEAAPGTEDSAAETEVDVETTGEKTSAP